MAHRKESSVIDSSERCERFVHRFVAGTKDRSEREDNKEK
jgi:hypothetical protein